MTATHVFGFAFDIRARRTVGHEIGAYIDPMTGTVSFYGSTQSGYTVVKTFTGEDGAEWAIVKKPGSKGWTGRTSGHTYSPGRLTLYYRPSGSKPNTRWAAVAECVPGRRANIAIEAMEEIAHNPSAYLAAEEAEERRREAEAQERREAEERDSQERRRLIDLGNAKIAAYPLLVDMLRKVTDRASRPFPSSAEAAPFVKVPEALIEEARALLGKVTV